MTILRLCVLASAAASTDLPGLYFRKSSSPFQNCGSFTHLSMCLLRVLAASEVFCPSACSLTNKGEGYDLLLHRIILNSPLAVTEFLVLWCPCCLKKVWAMSSWEINQLLIHVPYLAPFLEKSLPFLHFVSTCKPVIQELPPSPHFLKKLCTPVLKASCGMA